MVMCPPIKKSCLHEALESAYPGLAFWLSHGSKCPNITRQQLAPGGLISQGLLGGSNEHLAPDRKFSRSNA